MNYAGIPIEIGATRRRDDELLALARVRSIDDLFNGFLTDVFVLPNRWLFIVDSFPFLHSVLAANHCLQGAAELAVDVGAGLEIHGYQQDRNGVAFNVRIVAGGLATEEQSVTTSALVLALSSIAADLSRSISVAGIDVSEALRKFPPALFPFQDLSG